MKNPSKNLVPGGSYVSLQQWADQFGRFQAAGGHESEGTQPLGKESPDDPLTGDREALRRTIHQPERQCGQADTSGLGCLHHSGGVWFFR